METINLIEYRLVEDKIQCPNCHEKNYASYHISYDDEWISVQCECLTCATNFQINYRAAQIDVIKNRS